MDITGYMSIMIWFSADVQKLDAWWKNTQRCFGKKKMFFLDQGLGFAKTFLHGTMVLTPLRLVEIVGWISRCTPSSPSKPVRQDDFCNGFKIHQKRAAFASDWYCLHLQHLRKWCLYNFYKSFKFDQLEEISGFFAAWSKHQIVTSTLYWHICFRFPMMLKIQLHPAVTVGYFKNPAISADDRCFNALQRSLEQRPPRTAMRCGILKVFEIHIRQTFQETPVFSQL